MRVRGEKGLTITELIVAIAILSLGSVGALTILTQAHKTNNASQAKTMATNAAEEQMEQIFNAAPSNVLAFHNQTFNVGDLRRPGGAPAGLITVAAGDPHLVTVTVVWQGQGTLSPGQVTLRALRSEAQR